MSFKATAWAWEICGISPAKKLEFLQRADKGIYPSDKTIKWAKKRHRLVERHNGLCAYCGIETKSNFHLDHVVPKAMGGSNGDSNLVVSCPSCNLRKSNLEFYPLWWGRGHV